MGALKKEQQGGGIYNYFEGATINHLVINGNMAVSHRDTHSEKKKDVSQVSDRQIVQAIESISGEGKPLDTSRLWAAVYWFLRWNCNYPVKAVDFCERIAKLPFTKQLAPECKYENIRKYVTLTFMNQDARNLDAVKPNKMDEPFYIKCREVVLALKTELDKYNDSDVTLFPN